MLVYQRVGSMVSCFDILRIMQRQPFHRGHDCLGAGFGCLGPSAQMQLRGRLFFFPSWFNQFEAFLGSIFQEEPEQSMRLHWDDGPSGHHHLQLLNVLWHRDPLWPQSSAWLWCLGRCYILLIPVGYQKCGFSSNVWGLAIKHGNMPDVNHGCLMIDGFL